MSSDEADDDIRVRARARARATAGADKKDSQQQRELPVAVIILHPAGHGQLLLLFHAQLGPAMLIQSRKEDKRRCSTSMSTVSMSMSMSAKRASLLRTSTLLAYKILPSTSTG